MTRQIRAWPRRTRDGATLACPRARCPPLCRFPLRRLSAVALRPPLPSVTFEISPQRGQAADISRKNHIDDSLAGSAPSQKHDRFSISEVLPRTGARGADSPRVPRRLPVPSALVRPSSSSFHAPSRRPRSGMRELRDASRTRSLPAARLQRRRARTHRLRARPSPRREVWPCGLSRVAARVPALLALTPAGALLGLHSQARYSGRARSDRPVGGSRAPGRQAVLPHCNQHNGLL